jgi:hypothetical protein
MRFFNSFEDAGRLVTLPDKSPNQQSLAGSFGQSTHRERLRVKQSLTAADGPESA